MAYFNIAWGNHLETATFIEDIVVYLRLALLEAGHEVKIDMNLDPRAINILLEAFNEPTTNNIIAEIKRGTKVIVIATELLSGQTFNNYGVQEAGNDRPRWRSVWDERFANFARVARACKHLWCLAKEQQQDYARYFPTAKVQWVPYGYVDGYATVEQRPDSKKEIDFLLTGQLTGRREEFLGKLQKAGATVMAISPKTPTYARSDIVARARICVGIKQHADWPLPSIVRMYYHVSNQSYLLSERCVSPSVIDAYSPLADSDSFVETALAALKAGDYSSVASHNFHRFRDEMPLKPLFAPFVEQTLAIIESRHIAVHAHSTQEVRAS